jgi:aminoglycoside phosphotransferase (APT) family kinase protein
MSAPQDPASIEQVPHGHTARRLEWLHLPPGVRRQVEDRLGSPVARAQSQDSGFTPGFASRLTGEDGNRMFVKAASKKAQKGIAAAYADEVRKLRLLPDALPAPKLLWSDEDDLWVLLGFECIEGGNPARPFRRAELDACLDTLERVADVLDPVPADIGANPVTEDLPSLVGCWGHVRQAHPDWPHLADAVALAERFDTFRGNDALVHSDARDDNFLLDGSGRALLCDWNWPTLGPVWMDTVDLLVQAFGDGIDVDPILAERRLTKDAEPDHVDAWLAMLWGYMLEARDRPAPATSPYLRVHSRWFSEATWALLAHRRGWV